ncbi:MAG: glycosyl hydrolase [Bacteroidia bacterium]
MDIGQTDLPDGDYGNNDLTYQVSPNPLAYSDVLGDRVLRMDLNWQAGVGEFGKATSRFIELNATGDYLNFYFYNPLANGGSASVQVAIAEDDNQNNYFEGSADDKWISNLSIGASSGWQFFSLPLSSFQDANPGGNGSFDAGYTGAGGMLFTVSFVFTNPNSNVSSQYFLDMISFSEGPLPQGSTIFDLPFGSGGHCMLGALTSSAPQQVPQEVEGFFQTGKKLSYVSWFLYYSESGTTPDVYPGQEVADLLNTGYRPVITWEMMYKPYARLDPVQPRLDKILNGYFDWYIDAFADKIKSYDDTIIMRIFHEFEGDWYPWSLTENNQDPNIYIAAYRHIVDRFNAQGATKVLWMWCLNAETKPYLRYNWVVSAYPGDAYVDIVATDIYNHPDPGIPAWKSFRYTAAESYYYLKKYFPQKPIFICEVACRERVTGEVSGSQTKADWICDMNKELRSYFGSVRTLIFFSELKEHDWRINSSPQAQDAFNSCYWSDPYFGKYVSEESPGELSGATIYPNPFLSETSLAFENAASTAYELRLYDIAGKNILVFTGAEGSKQVSFGRQLSPGMYLLHLKTPAFSKVYKLVKTALE